MDFAAIQYAMNNGLVSNKLFEKNTVMAHCTWESLFVNFYFFRREATGTHAYAHSNCTAF